MLQPVIVRLCKLGILSPIVNCMFDTLKVGTNHRFK